MTKAFMSSQEDRRDFDAVQDYANHAIAEARMILDQTESKNFYEPHDDCPKHVNCWPLFWQDALAESLAAFMAEEPQK